MKEARIVLADDHEVFCEGLKTLLEDEKGLEVVGLASDGREALELVRQLSPDLVIMDLSMPGWNGLEATQRITCEHNRVRVLCLSVHAEPQFVAEALRAGASGYLIKDNAFKEVVRAVRTVVAGQTYLCPRVAGGFINTWRSRDAKTRAGVFRVLSEREREVLQLIAEGHSTGEIASRLHLSVKTVGTHRHNIMEKTGIGSVAGLTKYAVAEGLTDLNPGSAPSEIN